MPQVAGFTASKAKLLKWQLREQLLSFAASAGTSAFHVPGATASARNQPVHKLSCPKPTFSFGFPFTVHF